MSEPETEIRKQSFAAYITQKRKEAGLTQEELAKKLYVTHSTVSKWERGLSYPDIELVSDVCRELSISEHEFFTACDDVAMNREKQEASSYRKLLLRWKNTFLGCYLAAIVICFICDLATRHGLDWFWIVLTSLMLSFSFTNLPLLVKREKGVVCLGSATVSLFLLLLSCWGYTRGPQLGFASAVTAVCLALPWGLYLLARFCPKYRGFPAIVMAFLTVWNFLLVLLCTAVTGNDVRFGFLVTALSYVPIWCIFAVAAYVPLHGCLKAGLICLISAFTVPYLEVSFSKLLLQTPEMGWSDFFNWNLMLYPDLHGMWINVLIFAAVLVGGLIVTAVGATLQIRRMKCAGRAVRKTGGDPSVSRL